MFPLTTESTVKRVEHNTTFVFIVDVRSTSTRAHAMKKLSHINVVNALIRPDGKKKAYVH
jgi:ribosomal protein L23